MMRSLYTGVSGLTNHQVRMDVLSNNIANVNTIGYKANRTVFADTLSQSMAGAAPPTGNRGGVNPMQIGLGVQTAAVDVLFTQGSHQTTNKYTDVAINGDGFFVVSDGLQDYYTRAGNFGFDLDGNLTMNGSTLKVQGWMADANFNINSAAPVGDIVIPKTYSVASKISSVAEFIGNLKANADVSKSYSASEKLIDSMGNSHEARTTYTKLNHTGTGASWLASTTVSDAVTGTVTNTSKIIEFDGNGNFVSATDLNTGALQTETAGVLSGNIFGNLNLSDAAVLGEKAQATGMYVDASGNVRALGVRATCTGAPDTWKVEILENGNVVSTQSISGPAPATAAISPFTLSDGTTITLTDSINIPGGATNVTSGAYITAATNNPLAFTPNGGALPMTVQQDFSQLTQYSTDFTVKQTTDGYAAGTMTSQSIDQAGVIVGHFSNGKNFNLGQIAMATFQNQEGLEKVGGTLFRETNNSGIANVGEAGTDNRGSLSPGKLEMANVDLSEEFTNMIVTQRGFQSNSRVITTSDEMLQELIGLKR